MSNSQDSPSQSSLTPMDIEMNAPGGSNDVSLGSAEFHSPGQAKVLASSSQELLPFPQVSQSSQSLDDPSKSSMTDRTTATRTSNEKQEKSLAEFLVKMDNYTPIIPDAVTDYYLSRAGFDCDDVRIKRLLALAAQKFVADIATDAFQYCKVRQSGQRGKLGKERKTVLTMEDLSSALGECGVNVKKPDYYS